MIIQKCEEPLLVYKGGGTFTVQVRHKYTKEIIFSQKRFCPGDFTINAPLGSYQVRLISNSRIWRTDWEDFTLS